MENSNEIFQKSLNLPMVSESLSLTFNLLTGYYSRLLAFGSVTSFFWEWSMSELSGFCVFLENDRQHGSARNFFQGLEDT